MDHPKTILVAVDFSPCSAAALREATRIAAWTNAEVRAVHVVDVTASVAVPQALMPMGAPLLPMLQEDLAGRARRRWKEFLRNADGRAGTTLTVEFGSARQHILNIVRRDRPDLLVIGAHSDADAGRGVGPTAAACAQRAETKVLVIREAQAGPFRSVVACVDFSGASRVAVEQAISIAAQDGAALHMLHVYSDPWHGAEPPDAVKRHMPDFSGQFQESMTRELKRFCEPLSHELNALKPEYHAVQAPRHADGILRFARGRGCDLVVLGTRGTWNLRDFFWGSTAERVVRECPSCVLALKPPGFVQDAPYQRFSDSEAVVHNA